MSKNKTNAADKLFRKRDADAAMKEYEQEKQAEAQKTERLRALRLAKEAEDRETAEAARAEIAAGTDFADVARRLEEGVGVTGEAGGGGEGSAPFAGNGGAGGGAGFVGGSLGELSRDDLPPAFADVILELATGEVSEVVEAEYGFHLFQVTERLPAETVPLEEAWDEVLRELHQQRADGRLTELAEEARTRYEVAVWERNLPFNYRGVYRADAG